MKIDPTVTHRRTPIVARLFIGMIRGYQLVLSPLKYFLFGSASSCRFQPTCSEYARQAILKHGALKGSWLALRRISRCHPLGGCGYDPVPEKKDCQNPRCCSRKSVTHG